MSSLPRAEEGSARQTLRVGGGIISRFEVWSSTFLQINIGQRSNGRVKLEAGGGSLLG